MRFAKSRLLVALVALLALVAGACSDDGEIGGPSIGGSAAAVVGDSVLSHADLADLVDRWAASPQFLASATPVTDVGAPARRPASLVSFVLNFWLQSEQGRLVSESPAGDDAGTVAALTQQFPAFADYDEDFQAMVAESLGHQNTLVMLTQQGTPIDLPPVEVSSRYGTAVDLGSGVVGVDPPAGPAPAPGEPFGF